MNHPFVPCPHIAKIASLEINLALTNPLYSGISSHMQTHREIQIFSDDPSRDARQKLCQSIPFTVSHRSFLSVGFDPFKWKGSTTSSLYSLVSPFSCIHSSLCGVLLLHWSTLPLIFIWLSESTVVVVIIFVLVVSSGIVIAIVTWCSAFSVLPTSLKLLLRS